MIAQRLDLVEAIDRDRLQDLDHDIDSDVLVCGDDHAAKETVIDLARKAGMRALDAGPLINATVVEGMTSVLIALNKRYKSRNAGIRITSISDQ